MSRNVSELTEGNPEDVLSREQLDAALYRRTNLFSPALSSETRWDVAAFMLTHLGQSAPWCSPPEAWLAAQEQLRDESRSFVVDRAKLLDQSVLVGACLKPLLSESMRLSHDLHRGINVLHTKLVSSVFLEDFNFVQSAFSPSPKSKSPATIDYVHWLFRALLTDRVITAFSECSPNNPRQNTAYRVEIQKLRSVEVDAASVSPRLAECRNNAKRWAEVLRSFIQNWDSYNGQAETSSIQEVAEKDMQTLNVKLDKAVGRDLKKATVAFSATGEVHHAFSNLCAAASGVYDTLEVRCPVLSDRVNYNDVDS